MFPFIVSVTLGPLPSEINSGYLTCICITLLSWVIWSSSEPFELTIRVFLLLSR